MARFREKVKPTKGRSFPVNPLSSCADLYFSKWKFGSGLSGSNSSKCDVSAAPSRLGTYGGTAKPKYGINNLIILGAYATTTVAKTSLKKCIHAISKFNTAI